MVDCTSKFQRIDLLVSTPIRIGPFDLKKIGKTLLFTTFWDGVRGPLVVTGQRASLREQNFTVEKFATFCQKVWRLWHIEVVRHSDKRLVASGPSEGARMAIWILAECCCERFASKKKLQAVEK